MFHVSDYLEQLCSRGRAATTIRQHGGTLSHFCEHLANGGTASARGITESAVGDYLSVLRASGMSPDRYRQVVIRIRDYLDFLVAEGVILLSPLPERVIPRYHRSCATPAARQGVSELLDRVRTDRPFYVKGKAIMEVAYSSALRPREVYSLEIVDIDAGSGQLFIQQSKSRKDRIVPVGPTALKWLARYIDEVRSRYLRRRGHHRVFIKHHNGAPEDQEGIARAVCRTLRASGLPIVRPREFRAIAATDMHRGGMHAVHISRLLGHSLVETTERYLRLQESRLAAVLSEAHPRLQLTREEHK